MATDRFILWEKSKPSPMDVANLLSRYFGTVATDYDHKRHESENGYTWTITLRGAGCHPLSLFNPRLKDVINEERWIEIWLTDDYMDVMTRQQDPLVNAIAEGFAALIAGYYEAKRE